VLHGASRQARNGEAVACDTHLGIALAQPDRVETGTVRVEPEAASHRRVTRGAVPLHVARDTRLERLSGRLTVSQDERGPAIVEAGAAQGPSCAQSGLGVAGHAELLGIVTVGAGRLPRVRGGGMPDQEAGGMVIPAPGRLRRVGTVTGEAGGLHVAHGTGPGRRAGFAGVPLPERSDVGTGRMPYELSARCTPGRRLVHRGNRLRQRGPDVTGGTTRLGVAGGAARRIPLGLATMQRQEIRCGVSGRRAEGKAMRQGPLVPAQRLDGRGLRGVDVTV